MDISKEKATDLFVEFLQIEWIGKNVCGITGDSYDCTYYAPISARNIETSTGEELAYYNKKEMQFCYDIAWLILMIEFIEEQGYGSELSYVPRQGYRLQFYKEGKTVVSTFWFSTKLQSMWNSCAEFIIYYNDNLLKHVCTIEED